MKTYGIPPRDSTSKLHHILRHVILILARLVAIISIMITRRPILLAACLVLTLSAFGGTKTSSRLIAALTTLPEGHPVAAWVYFVDKGPAALSKSINPEELVTDRSIRRRMKSLPVNALVDETDRPVHSGYVTLIAQNASRVRQTSKWLNAASIDATREQLEVIEQLPCVQSVDVVVRFGRRGSRDTFEKSAPQLEKGLQKSNDTHTLDYGGSLAQVNLENIPAVHDMGFAGQGVIVGIFDNGFRLLSHEAFDTLRPRIIAQHDFVDHKTSVAPNDPVYPFGEHGVETLSTLGGYAPGTLIGPAFRSSFILARTENDSSETPMEEDNWVRAIEWADSLGVEVTSTSLGYYDYDPPYTSWTWADLDGKTTAITKAAVWAARKGILVVNSAGNEGITRETLPNSLNAPADADSILSVGAVTPSGVRASFSSNGPTADGRIKPDVMAVGASVHVAVGAGTNLYSANLQGTSFSCPLTAGVAAMLLSADPQATAMQIITAMKSTANNASNPNNFYGWGVVNALAAIRSLNPGRWPTLLPGEIQLQQNFPNPFNPTTHIRILLSEPSQVTLRIYDLMGKEVTTLVNRSLPPSLTAPYEAVWNGTDEGGSTVASGVYIYRLIATGASGTTTLTRKMILVR
jgi:serine protease AprX